MQACGKKGHWPQAPEVYELQKPTKSAVLQPIAVGGLVSPPTKIQSECTVLPLSEVLNVSGRFLASTSGPNLLKN